MRLAKLTTLLLLLLPLACDSPEERLGKHIARAEEYVASEQWNEARIEYLNVLQLDPGNAGAHFELGEVLWELEAYGDARWQYKEAVRLDPANVEARLRLAKVEMLVQRPKDAEEHLAYVLEREPENIDALLLRGTLASRSGDVNELLNYADRALEVDPSHEGALTLKAQAYELARRPEEAEQAVRKLVEMHPTAANLVRLALVLSSRDRRDEAIEAFRAAARAAEDQTERTRTRLVFANALFQTDAEAAERELLAAQQDDPENAEVLLALARFYVYRGEIKRAEEMLELHAASRPDDLAPLLALARFHRMQGSRDAMMAAVERALAIDPESEVALLAKAEALKEDAPRDPEADKEARGILSEVLERNPNSVMGTFVQGRFLLMDGRPEEAAARLRRVVDEEPSSAAYLLLGTAYLQMGEGELARSELLRAVQLDPSNTRARIQLAALYAQTGEQELAAQEAREALKGRPGDVQLLVLLAGALRGMDRSEEAEAVLDRIDVKRSLEERPRLRLELASLYRRVGNLDKARALLEEEAEASPDDPGVPRQLALLELAERNPLRSVEILTEALERFPEEAALWELRARVRLGFTSNGKLPFAKEAEVDLRAAIEHGEGKSVEPYMLLATLYQQQNRLEEAVAAYEDALLKEPRNARVHLVLGMLYERMGRVDEAVSSYEAVVQYEPMNGVALNNLAWLLATQRGDPKDLDRALKLAQKAKEVMPESPSVADTLGWVMLKRDMPTTAISLFREALDAYEEGSPVRALIRYHLAQAYRQGGETERAIEELQAALAEAPSFPERSRAEALLKQLEAS